MDHLDAAMADGGTAVLCQVLSGTGGVGKTQLAARYARHQWSAGTVDLLVWVTAGNRDAIVSSYAHAGRKLAGADGGDPEQAAQDFLIWLEVTDRRWLVVLDDLADPGDLRSLWPPEHPTGRVVVTTRRQDAALAHDRRRFITVGLFTPEEATAYLVAKFAERDIRDDPEEIRGLAADLGCLPLALAQATAYMADRRMGCGEYRRRLADRRSALSEILPEDGALPDEQRSTVAATWSLSIELADQLKPVGLARPMLRLASMLNPNGIPLPVLTSPAALACLGPTARLPETAREAMLCLQRLSLVDVDLVEGSLRVHSLIQRATRDESVAAGDEFGRITETAAQALLEAWPAVEADMGGEVLRANTEALHRNSGSILWSAGTHDVLLRAGRSLGRAGQLASAIDYWEKLQNVAEDCLGPDHPDSLAIRGHLIGSRFRTGDRMGAITAATHLLDDWKRSRGPDHLGTLTIRSNIAEWLGRSGDLDAAISATSSLLADQTQVLGAEHSDTWATHRMLIHWHLSASDPGSAIAELRKLYAIQLRALGPEHSQVLFIRRRLAMHMLDTGESPLAEVELREVLAILNRTLGPEHSETVRTSRALTHCVRLVAKLKRQQQAEESRDGPHSAAASGTAKSVPKQAKGKPKSQAVIALEGHIAARRVRAGNNGASISILRRHLALQREQEDGRTDAVAALRLARDDIERNLGPDHRETLAVRGAIAEWLKRAGRLTDAASMLEVLLDDTERLFGQKDRATVATRAHLRSVLQLRGGDARSWHGRIHRTTSPPSASKSAYFLRWRAADGTPQSMGPFESGDVARQAGVYARNGGGTAIQVVKQEADDRSTKEDPLP
ncbi:tetratricopeptide repeat protein [Streptomyces sp. BV286]|uniref:tetratricopeptide repeat protein n=1 Tax=unclassified Streptomyces TaxID=2593676 RepID=UPI001C2E4CF3|nr:tetratricopeptide repeat protein [Streptomyces sp. BV286]MBV1941038.1 tetratricopeptide repeat protein [Streptomyces sp. BV286]